MGNDIVGIRGKVRIMATLCAIALYILCFFLLLPFYKEGMGAGAVIPVIVVGWCFGWKAGIIAAILSFPANILMSEIVGANWWEKMVLSGGGITGTLALMLVGAVVGRISDLQIALKREHDKNKKEIDERKRVEEAARESNRHLENVFKTSADGIIITDSQGFITMINEAVENMLGYAKDELLGKHPVELAPEGDHYKEESRRYFETLIDKNIAIGFEHTWQKSNGDLINIEISSSLLIDKDGNVIGGVINIRDITERKTADRKLRESKEFLENIFKTSVDGIMASDPHGYIVMVNEAVEKMVGYSHDELIGKHVVELTSEDEKYRKRGMELITTLLESGVVTGFENVWLRKDGRPVNVDMNIALIKDKIGNTTGAIGSIRDITERKKIEAALKVSEEKYRSLIENANDAIISIDQDGSIIGFNKKAEGMFGYSSDEIVGKSSALLKDPSIREEHKKVLQGIKKTKAFNLKELEKPSEQKGLRKDGQEISIECSSFRVETAGESIYTTIARDITERKELECKLFQSEKLKSLGELAGGVAHDFNNVLAAILGRTQLLKMDLEPPAGVEEKRKSIFEIEKSIEVIEQAARDGAETVKRIQEFARRREDDKHFKEVDLNEVIDNALEFTRARWTGEAQGRGIEYAIQKEFSPLPLTSGSAAELREVFTNLINNALDAMPQGGSLEIKTCEINNHAVVQFSDTGCGIPQSIKDKIFDPFFTTKGVQSTGLGMSVSYGIISRHKGSITVDSREGQGTTFTIKLPVSENRRKAEGAVETRAGEQKRARILVIDDEEKVRNALVTLLRKSGHEVVDASNGKEGIALFKQEAFDLVCTDLGMPEMSGWQVAERIKNINGRIPVAIITGWNVEISESEMKDKWVDLIIQKPFEISQIRTLVQDGMILKDRFRAA